MPSRAGRARCRSARSRTSRVDGLPGAPLHVRRAGREAAAALPARRRLRGRRPRHPRRAVPRALPPRGRRRAQRRVPQGARAPVPGLRRGRAHARTRGRPSATTRVAVGGDSAGGNLAATIAIEFDPVLALLIYPVVDATQVRRSRQLFGKGFFLTDELMKWYTGHFMPEGADPADPLRSPILSPASSSDSAPALVVTAGFDPLRDEGEAYARGAARAGRAGARAPLPRALPRLHQLHRRQPFFARRARRSRRDDTSAPTISVSAATPCQGVSPTLTAPPCAAVARRSARPRTPRARAWPASAGTRA